MASGIKPPNSLVISDISLEDFKLWCEAFEDFILLSQGDKCDDKKKI